MASSFGPFSRSTKISGSSLQPGQSPCFSKRSQDFLREMRVAEQLVDRIRYNGGIEIRTRTYHLRSYYACFVASELVDWLVNNTEAETRDDAVGIGQMLVRSDYIHHVVDEHDFEDGFFFFRFRQDEPPTDLKGPTLTCIRGQEGSFIAEMFKKRLVGYSLYTFAFSPVNCTLYQFRNEITMTPMFAHGLKGATIKAQSREHHNKFSIQFAMADKKSLTLVTSQSHQQLKWLELLAENGLKVLPHEEEDDGVASDEKSIYDFSATDIDDNVVSMEKYRNSVCLVVNEPGTEEEIKQFAAGFGVEFDIFGKINVNGSNAHPLYKFLKKKQSGNFGSFIKWNYTKEPGTNEEIKQFAAGYGVEFDMFSKINVNGSNAHPLFKYLQKNLTGYFGK
nr:glutathione peroxidase isoform 2 [Halisarca dujardinii]